MQEKGIELEGAKLTGFDYGLPWHKNPEVQVVPNQNPVNRHKNEVNYTTKLGLQFGAEAKILGIPDGLSMDFGSVKLGNFSISNTDGKSKFENGIESGYTTTVGGSIGLGVLGYETTLSTTKYQDGSTKRVEEETFSVLMFSSRTTSEKTTNVYGKTENKSYSDNLIGQTAIKGKFLGSMSLSAASILPALNSVIYKDYNTTDNTRVSLDKSSLNLRK